MRINVAVSGIDRVIRWTEQELSSDKSRGSYSNTIRTIDKMISDAEHLLSNLRKLRGFDGGNSNGMGSASDVDMIVTTTISALEKLGYLTKPSVQQSTPTDSYDIQSTTNTETKVVEAEIVPMVSIEPVKQKSTSTKKKTNWKLLNKQYSLAISAMSKIQFENPVAQKCANYIKRWFDTLKVGFKHGVKLGADMFANVISRISVVVAHHIDTNTMDEWEKDFSRWEDGVRYGTWTYSMPEEVAIFANRSKDERDAIYGRSDSPFDAFIELFNLAFQSVSRSKNGGGKEYLTRDSVYEIF